MDPLASTNAASVVRPTAAVLAGDLASLLRDGRVLAGEVLASPGDGTVLLAIGRQQVPAQTALALEPESRHLFQVQETAAGIVLRVLGLGGEESALLVALRRVVGEGRPIGELLGRLAAVLEGSRDARLVALLGALAAHVLEPGAGGEDLRRLLALSGLRYEPALAAALGRARAAEGLGELRADLKAQLLAALAELPDVAGGPEREAVARALAGLEAEQLLNLARRQAGEPWIWSLPVPDVEGWTTARLWVERREREAEDGAEDAARVVVGATFSALGPVRADLFATRSSLVVRLLVTREAAAERLRAGIAELTSALDALHGGVQVFVGVGEPAEVALGERPLDIRYLRDHHLMDVSG
jgi:hypothetical protein